LIAEFEYSVLIKCPINIANPGSTPNKVSIVTKLDLKKPP